MVGEFRQVDIEVTLVGLEDGDAATGEGRAPGDLLAVECRNDPAHLIGLEHAHPLHLPVGKIEAGLQIVAVGVEEAVEEDGALGGGAGEGGQDVLAVMHQAQVAGVGVAEAALHIAVALEDVEDGADLLIPFAAGHLGGKLRLGDLEGGRVMLHRQHLERLPGGMHQEFRGVTELDEKLVDEPILGAVEQVAGGIFAVASGASGLLVIGFEAARGVEVDDPAHVRAVDPHAEGVGGGDHRALVADEAVLDGGAVLVGEAGVVGQTAGGIGDLFHILAGGGIDDGGKSRGGEAPQQVELFLGPRAGVYLELQIGPLEAGDAGLHRGAVELAHNVLAHHRGGGGGEGRHLRDAQLVDEFPDAMVIRPEVMAPLADAVRLVDHEEGGTPPQDRLAELPGAQPLGRDVEQLQLAGEPAPDHLPPVCRREGAVEERRRDATSLEGIHLVLHQRDEWRNDERQARPHDRRKLVAEGLAGAGGHHHAKLPPRHQLLYHVLLPLQEPVKPEMPLESVESQTHFIDCR